MIKKITGNAILLDRIIVINLKQYFLQHLIGLGYIYLQLGNGIHKEKLKKLGLSTGTKDNCRDLITAFLIKAEMIAGQIIFTVKKKSCAAGSL